MSKRSHGVEGGKERLAPRGLLPEAEEEPGAGDGPGVGEGEGEGPGGPGVGEESVRVRVKVAPGSEGVVWRVPQVAGRSLGAWRSARVKVKVSPLELVSGVLPESVSAVAVMVRAALVALAGMVKSVRVAGAVFGSALGAGAQARWVGDGATRPAFAGKRA